ncbi:protein RRP6-like 2 [Cornus florida]|uniref:protein RRP6-like 2 n=1 Tax=Cornus florida TaxID=4283 RepID=UPI0028A22752|nr:protein RRP6-like 2 [Cornus florida]
MEIDPSQGQSLKQKAETLQGLTKGPLSSSIAKLSGSSRGIPSDKDFHFYYNFDEFKVPIKEIAEKSQSMLETIGSSAHVWEKDMTFPEDLEEAYDWLVNVNDEFMERFDVSVDEYQRMQKKEEETGVRMTSSVDSESGFQLVYGKKKKGASQVVEKSLVEESSSSAVKVASRDKKTTGTKPKVPFHIPTIPRPQDEFKILVNNSNQPFEHVWLQRSDDGSRLIHPLEKLSVLDFVDKDVGDFEPVKPPPVESTPFKLVEDVKDLKELAAKLRGVNEFAVDLEHNQYRSFQGLTCLMQISTRTEDFVVDTLKLRIHIGPYLREVFKDPTKKKVMHGADRDIVWLQRDFGIYICNLFDTGQASRMLKLERNSLEYLLQHFCGVTANKEYQNADWRLRPLPDEMLRYAREDTHYLLYIYDLMRISLLSSSVESENSDALLEEVYKRSYDICMQLYEKEILTDSSYLYIYGLPGADLDAQQLAIVAGLCEWRDVVARAEDESTGYILPNKTLLEIAKYMPVTPSKLRRMLKSKHPHVERNLGSVVGIIKHSIQNAAAFEPAAEHLKEGRKETASEENLVVYDGPDGLPPSEASERLKNAEGMDRTSGSNTAHNGMFGHPPTEESMELQNSTGVGRSEQGGFAEHSVENGNVRTETESCSGGLPRDGINISVQHRDTNANISVSQSVTGATVQVLKRPSRAFGSLLGNSSLKRKFDPNKKEKEEIKLEQIKSSVNLPFHSFSGRDDQLQPVVKEATRTLEISDCEPVAVPSASSNAEDIIRLEGDANVNDPVKIESQTTNEQLEHREDNTLGSSLEIDDNEETMSLSDLSSSFQKCFQSMNQTAKARLVEKPQQPDGFLQLKPFDYEAARNQINFGEDRSKSEVHEAGDRKKKSSVTGRVQKAEGAGDFPQGRRRQAFPASGNRSATFR